MTRLLSELPLPRKLDSANATLPELAQKTFTFTSDVVAYLRARDANIEAVLQAFNKRIEDLENP